MEKQKRKVEVFTAGCPVCDPVAQMVQSLACADCDVTIYNLAQPCESKVCLDRAKDYSIRTLPAVAVDGKLLSCC